jgi:hypothetical protein
MTTTQIVFLLVEEDDLTIVTAQQQRMIDKSIQKLFMQIHQCYVPSLESHLWMQRLTRTGLSLAVQGMELESLVKSRCSALLDKNALYFKNVWDAVLSN